MRIVTLLTLVLAGFGTATSGQAMAGEAAATSGTLYKNPLCGCCESYADYLRESGISVTVKASHDLALVKRQHGVPAALEGCHTMLIDGYVVEGHVPFGALEKLFSELPDITGISLPGMPTGSPGMAGPKKAPFTVYAFSGEAAPKVYAVE